MTGYLDANATEPLRPGALTAMIEAAGQVGNPSSVHLAGRAARRILETARGSIATAFGTGSEEVIFTSGGTEANMLAVHSCREIVGRDRRVLIGATEHDAVRRSAPCVDTIAVHANGMLDLRALAVALEESQPALVCVMAANNETGVCHPLTEVAALCRARGVWLHVDAVQSAGRIPSEFAITQADSMAISSHKFGGPKGAGALLLARPGKVVPLLCGGGQERGRRGGTPALPALAGMAAALEEARVQDWRAITHWRDRLERRASAAGALIAGGAADRLPNTTQLILPGVSSQAQLMTLDLEGLCVSAGSACSSGKVSRSHVLEAMGLGERAGQAIRVSLPWNVEDRTIARFEDVYAAMAMRLGGKG